MTTVDNKPTTPLAIWSLILGITSLVFCCLPSAIPAIICGHLACSKIKRSSDAITGRGMALAGLIMGYISVALFVGLCVLGAIAVVVCRLCQCNNG